MKISENTSISMPARNLISIVTACIVGAWFGFGVIERLNIIETELQLMNQDLLAASTQKPVEMEQFMLLEFISKEHGKLKDDVEWLYSHSKFKGHSTPIPVLIQQDYDVLAKARAHHKT